MNDNRPLPPSAVALTTLLCVTWGLGQVAIKVGNQGISPIWQAALRSVGAALLMLAWVAWRRTPLGNLRETLPAGIAAGVLFALEFVFLFAGLVYTNAARAALLLYAAPFFVALGTHLFVPGDRLTRGKLVGLLAAFVGLLLAFVDRLTVPDMRALMGDLLCLLGALMWGSTTVVIKASALRRAPPEATLLYQLAVSVPVLVARHRATTMHAFTFLTPLFGVLAGALLLGEPVGPAAIASLALIAAGIVLVNRG